MNMVPVIDIEGVKFEFVLVIEPEKNADGVIAEFMPQSRYKGAGTERLNRHGNGPFCKFRVPRDISYSGVYDITVSDEVRYIGECVDLSKRWGLSQYGSISPKNCYVGGQSTNCKINGRILSHSLNGEIIRLWFYQTSEHKAVESRLLSNFCPSWNG